MQGLHIGQHIFARRLCQSPALCLIRLFISKSSTMVSGQFFRGLPAFPSALKSPAPHLIGSCTDLS